jgi:hypothetical protein
MTAVYIVAHAVVAGHLASEAVTRFVQFAFGKMTVKMTTTPTRFEVARMIN